MWDEITHPFPNFKSGTVEVWERTSNFIQHFTGHVITYPCYDQSTHIHTRVIFCEWL